MSFAKSLMHMGLISLLFLIEEMSLAYGYPHKRASWAARVTVPVEYIFGRIYPFLKKSLNVLASKIPSLLFKSSKDLSYSMMSKIMPGFLLFFLLRSKNFFTWLVNESLAIEDCELRSKSSEGWRFSISVISDITSCRFSGVPAYVSCDSR